MDKKFKIKVNGSWCEYQANKFFDLNEVVSFVCYEKEMGGPYRFYLRDGDYRYIERCEIGNQIKDALLKLSADRQSRQAEVDQLKEAMERQGKLAIQAMHEAHKGSRLELSIAKDIQASLKPELIESERQMNTQLTDENMRLEARIDAALKHANLNFWNAVTVGLMVKALRGDNDS